MLSASKNNSRTVNFIIKTDWYSQTTTVSVHYLRFIVQNSISECNFPRGEHPSLACSADPQLLYDNQSWVVYSDTEICSHNLYFALCEYVQVPFSVTFSRGFASVFCNVLWDLWWHRYCGYIVDNNVMDNLFVMVLWLTQTPTRCILPN